jgi:hypothetical protein
MVEHISTTCPPRRLISAGGLAFAGNVHDGDTRERLQKFAREALG